MNAAFPPNFRAEKVQKVPLRLSSSFLRSSALKRHVQGIITVSVKLVRSVVEQNMFKSRNLFHIFVDPGHARVARSFPMGNSGGSVPAPLG